MTAARIEYADLLEEIEGLPPDSASVTWVKGLDPESPVPEGDAILIQAQARLDRRRLFEYQSDCTTPAGRSRSVLESICAAAEAKLESSGGLSGFPTEDELFASQVIYLAQDGLDRLDEIQEEEGSR
jgi:hypothetical protein